LRHMGPRLGPAPSDIDNALVPAFLAAGFSRFRQVEHHRYDRTRLHELAFSSGYAPRQSHVRRRRALAEAIDDFHAAHGRDKAVRLSFETVAFLGTPRLGPQVDLVRCDRQEMHKPSDAELVAQPRGKVARGRL